MGHQVDRCDFVDMLEESAVTHRRVVVELRGGKRFTDVVREVVTRDGEDFATFRDHGQVAARDILDCVHAEPLETSYDAKL